MIRWLISVVLLALGSVLFEAATVEAQDGAAKRILIHMKTSLAQDDAQILCGAQRSPGPPSRPGTR
ncbi:MAG: hypothetical protein KatS3mg082_0785 [Nitrospiraceae bacterium]|nr:MAG: hypothetical protein KatS3mg082_0785 [Nitrospiraceae bacterium]